MFLFDYCLSQIIEKNIKYSHLPNKDLIFLIDKYKEILETTTKYYQNGWTIDYFHIIKDYPLLIPISKKILDIKADSLIYICRYHFYPEILYFEPNPDRLLISAIKYSSLGVFIHIVNNHKTLDYNLLYLKLCNRNYYEALKYLILNFNDYININYCDIFNNTLFMHTLRTRNLNLVSLVISYYKNMINPRHKNYKGYNMYDLTINDPVIYGYIQFHFPENTLQYYTL